MPIVSLVFSSLFFCGFHWVHPVQAYCTTSPPKKYLSKVMVGGCTNDEVAKNRQWEPYDTVEKAISSAQADIGRNASITYMSLHRFLFPGWRNERGKTDESQNNECDSGRCRFYGH